MILKCLVKKEKHRYKGIIAINWSEVSIFKYLEIRQWNDVQNQEKKILMDIVERKIKMKNLKKKKTLISRNLNIFWTVNKIRIRRK